MHINEQLQILSFQKAVWQRMAGKAATQEFAIKWLKQVKVTDLGLFNYVH